jgi:putative addiction module component (TIGR02574 family)
MSNAVQAVLQTALALPDEEQLELLTALWASVDERGLRPFDDWWLTEIERRSAEYDSGAVKAAPWAVRSNETGPRSSGVRLGD